MGSFPTPSIIVSIYDIWYRIKISLTVTTRNPGNPTRCWPGMLLNTLYCLRYILEGVLQLEMLSFKVGKHWPKLRIKTH